MDAIFGSWLEKQEQQALALAARSDLVDVHPIGTRPYQHFLLRFGCRGLVDTHDGVVEADRFDVGVYFPLDYWQRVDPFEVITLVQPATTFHPNAHGSLLCIGRISCGTPLTEIMYQCYEILSWQKVTMREDDALTKKACAWARRHPDRFPVDDRPMVGRLLEYRITAAPASEDTTTGATSATGATAGTTATGGAAATDTAATEERP
jgi:hypothetical protein